MSKTTTEPGIVTEPGTAITEFSQTEAGLAELRAELATRTFDCSTVKGDKEARGFRTGLTALRSAIESARKDLKAPLIERGRLIDAEAARIKDEILAMEAPLNLIIDAAAAEREERRIAKEREIAERLVAQSKEIDRIRNLPIVYFAAPLEVLLEAKAALVALDLADLFEEGRLEVADAVRAETAVTLNNLIDARHREIARDEEMAAQREALAAQQKALKEAAAAEQARAAEARRIEEERAAEERRAHDEQMAVQRADLAKQQEALALAEAEQRQAALRAAAEREAADAAERAQAERERKAAEEEAAKQKAIAAEEAAAERQKFEDEILAAATLRGAATDAHELLLKLAPAHLTTRALGAALIRDTEES